MTDQSPKGLHIANDSYRIENKSAPMSLQELGWATTHSHPFIQLTVPGLVIIKFTNFARYGAQLPML